MNARRPCHSINFVTAHDGFSLWDLVSYSTKRNEANGEGGRDGTNDNFSWNCGAEGETGDAGVVSLRERQARNAMVLLLLSRGTPMLLSGDEALHTRRGNNNWYGHDSGEGRGHRVKAWCMHDSVRAWCTGTGNGAGMTR